MRTADQILLGHVDQRPHKIPVAAFDGHAHLLSTTRAGKTYLLQHLFTQFAQRRNKRNPSVPENALVFIDPLGDAYAWLRRWCYTNGLDDRLVLIDPSEPDLIVGIDPLGGAAQEDMRIHAAKVTETILRVLSAQEYQQQSGFVRKITSFILYALMNAKLTLAEAPQVLNPDDEPFRDAVIRLLDDPVVRGQLMAMTDASGKPGNAKSFEILQTYLGSVDTRLGEYTANPTVRRMLGSPVALDWGRMLDERKIILISLLPTDRLTLTTARLLGIQIISQIVDECMKRARLGAGERVPCFLFIDECHNFSSPQLELALAQVGKFNLKLILAHQFLGQLRDDRTGSTRLIESVKQNTNTKIAFRIKDSETARIMAEDLYGPWLDLKTVKQDRWKQLSKVVMVRTRTRGTGDVSSFASGGAGGLATPTMHPDHPYPSGPTSQSSDFYTEGGGHSAFEAESEHQAVVPTEPFSEPLYWDRDELVHLASAHLMKLEQGEGVLQWGNEEPVTFRTPRLAEPSINEISAQRLDHHLRLRGNDVYLSAAQIDKAIAARRARVLETTTHNPTMDRVPDAGRIGPPAVRRRRTPPKD